jgi:DNA-binding NarL/FixJ family response regulator
MTANGAAGGSTSPVRVAIVEDQREIREGLAFLIDATAGYCCAGAFPAMEPALAVLTPAVADVVLMDLGLPGMSGIEGIRLLKARHPQLHLIALTIYEDNDRILEALCAGASGYLLKKTPPARLLECLQDTMRGGAPMSPEIAARVIALFREFRLPAPPEDHELTPHEVRILALLAEGHSVNTVAFHMKSIYGKLQVHSKSEAVAKALRTRIVQ